MKVIRKEIQFLQHIYETLFKQATRQRNDANRNSIQVPQRHPRVTPSILNYPRKKGERERQE